MLCVAGSPPHSPSLDVDVRRPSFCTLARMDESICWPGSPECQAIIKTLYALEGASAHLLVWPNG